MPQISTIEPKLFPSKPVALKKPTQFINGKRIRKMPISIITRIPIEIYAVETYFFANTISFFARAIVSLFFRPLPIPRSKIRNHPKTEYMVSQIPYSVFDKIDNEAGICSNVQTIVCILAMKDKPIFLLAIFDRLLSKRN